MSENKKGVTKFVPPIYDEDEDSYGIDHMLKEELEELGLEYRFVDFKQAVANGGSSRSGWRVYKRQSKDPILDSIPGVYNSDGLVRRGTMVLAVKTQKAAARQRQRRDEQNKYLNRYTENVTNELSGDARKLGSSQIIAGYDKNS